MINKKSAIVAAGLLFCLLTAPVWGRTYKIATAAWVGWSPLHVARAQGFWEKQGLSVEVINYDDPIIILEAVKAGKIDLAMDMVGSLVGIFMSGEPVVAIAETNWSHGGDKIIVKKGHTIKEYQHQPLGVFLDLPSCHYFLHRYLEPRGLAVSDFRVVEMHPDDLAAQFIAGRIPVIVNYEPWATSAVEKGNGVVLADSSDFAGCIPECMWAYRDHLRAIPDQDIEKILRGWIRAVQWIHRSENQSAYYEILNSDTFPSLPAYSENELQKMIQNVKIHTRADLVERNRTGGGLETFLSELKTFLSQSGRLEKDYEAGDIFDNTWIMKVLSGPPADN